MNLIKGREYIILFKDPHYPCDCDCHSKSGILHIVPCCYDLSYNGVATYLNLTYDENNHKVHIFRANGLKYYIKESELNEKVMYLEDKNKTLALIKDIANNLSHIQVSDEYSKQLLAVCIERLNTEYYEGISLNRD